MATAPFRLAGVIGWPIGQSRSPLIHGHWMAEHGIAGAYLPMAVRPEALETALRGLAALGFAGCNVTVPHKEAAARIVDRIDDVARRIGAVNTVMVEADGSLSGTNTDGVGFTESLRQGAPGWRGDEGLAVVLGAGGGARSVVASLLDLGVPEVRIANRTRARADQLRTEFGPRVTVVDWEKRAGALDGAALLVNTTKLGMTGEAPLHLPLDALPRAAVVTDIVFNPLHPPLLRDAAARGHRVVDGLGMLLHQARPAFRAWFGVDPRVTAELRAKAERSVAGQ
ncbi:MAG TPA: shikimate dehydrogenase [Acetobacteraceae bacterium]